MLSKRILLRHAPPLLNLTAWQMLFSTLALVMLAFVMPQRPIDWNWVLIGNLAYSSILSSSVGWGLWLIVLRRLSTTGASLGSLDVPVANILLAWVTLHERPDAMEITGTVFVLSGLAAVSGLRLRQGGGCAPG